MSRIKHPMTFVYGFFHENVQKSSIPKCQELSIRCHFYLDFSMKTKKKARYPNVRNSASHVSFVWIFPWTCQKKLDTQMSQIKHPMSVLYWFFHENVKKKLDTQMSRIKHPMSFLSGFFHENVKKIMATKGK